MAEYRDLSNIRGPFRISPKEKKEEPISTVDEYQDSFIKALEDFATIQTEQDIANFNKKYGVNLVLPSEG